jgi:hypothetical protein
MQATELAELFVELLDTQDELALDIVLTTLQEQMGGALDVGISNDQMLDTLLCHRNGECNCFRGMVSKIVDVLLDGEEDEGEPEEQAAVDPKFADLMKKVVTGRVQ